MMRLVTWVQISSCLLQLNWDMYFGEHAREQVSLAVTVSKHLACRCHAFGQFSDNGCTSRFWWSGFPNPVSWSGSW